MEEINWHNEPIAGNDTQQPLGRMLVPVGQSEEEPPKKKRRRKESGGNERRRLIIHIVILVVLLCFIVFGLYYFLHEDSRQDIPQINTSVQVGNDSLSDDE